jgi:hypothetical protein
MIKNWLIVTLFIGFALNSQPVKGGSTVTDAEIIDYGILSAQVDKTINDQSLVQGVHYTMKASRLLERTTEIFAEKGLKFGIKYLIKGYPIGSRVKLDFVVLYPEPGLTNPVSGKTDHQSMVSMVKKIGKITTSGYLFKQKWEMVPGQWTFQIWHDGRKLAEKNFIVDISLPPG